MHGMKILDAVQTRDALPFGPLIEALREMFATGCEVPLRHTHTVETPGEASATVLLMPAWTPGGLMGIKHVMVYPGNAARGLPGLHSTYMLYDAATGVPLALLDGNEITSRRTAAASALAASMLVAPGPRRQLVVGAGRVGRLIPEAYREVVKIESVAIWDRTPAHAAKLADDLRRRGIEASVATDLANAVREADIVTCATLATAPLVLGEWLRASAHLDLIGSFTPQMREADDACFADAHIFVDTDEAVRKSGDLLGPMSRGVFSANDVRGTLADLCRDPLRRSVPPGARTVFKSVGTALEDLAAAALVHQSLASTA